MTFARQLLKWYDRVKRDLPWRHHQDPYRVLVSEIMLQQTQVDTVISYYEPFLERFPDVAALARASEDDVLVAWKGLGYYRRAKHLHMAAKEIVEQYDGEVPSTYDELKKLPGIGPYTAAAVSSIAFGHPHAVVDGNVLRVAARLFRLTQPVDASSMRHDVQQRMDALISPTRPGDFNQAMMELGQSTCTVTSPRCDLCPVRSWCASLNTDDVHRLPIRGRKLQQKIEHRIVLVIQCGDDVLMRQRPGRGLLAGMWEFPGTIRPEVLDFDLDTGEHLDADMDREADTMIGAALIEMGMSQFQSRIALVKKKGRVTHRFTHLIWEMDVVVVQLADCGGVPDMQAPWQWVPRDHVTEKALPTAMLRVWQTAQAGL